MDFWEGLWLNEGFADWATVQALAIMEPTWGANLQFTTVSLQEALYLDSNGASHPIEIPVNKPSEINQIFDAISYSKGASVIRVISSFLGTDVFLKGVSRSNPLDISSEFTEY
jgi:aminopeptidase 2